MTGTNSQLPDKETWYQGLFENLPIGIYRTTPNGQILDVNQTLVQILGYQDREALLAINKANVYADPQDHWRGLANIEKIGALKNFEVRVQRYDGEAIWVQENVQVVRDVVGRVLFYEGSLQDITQQIQAKEALAENNRRLDLLNRTGRILASSLDLDQVLETVLEETRQLLGVMAVSIWLLDQLTNELFCRQASGPTSEIIYGWRLAPGEGLVGWVAQHNQSLIVPDLSLDERHFGGIAQKMGLDLRSIISVPMRARKQVIGVLQAVDAQVNRFDKSHLVLLEPLASSAAAAIESASLHERVQQELAERQRVEENLEWEMLVNASLADHASVLLDPATSLEQIAQVTLDYAREFTSSEEGFVSVLNPQTGDHVLYALAKKPGQDFPITLRDQAVIFSLEKAGWYSQLWNRVINTTEAFYNNAPEIDQLKSDALSGYVSLKNILIVPALVGERPPGLIVVFNARAGYTPRQLEATKRLAELYAAALQRRQMEQVLQDSEIRYRQLFENVPVGIYRSSLDGRILDANPATLEIGGYPDRETLMAMNARDNYINPDDRQQWREGIEQGTAVQNIEMQVRRYDGKIIWIQDKSQAVRDEKGQVLYYEGSMQDITERKQAEVALRESRARLQTLLDFAPVGIFETDREGNIVYVNQRWCDFTGLTPAQAAGRGWIQGLHPDERERMSKHWYDIVKENGEWDLEYRYITPEGKVTWVHGTAVALEADGEITGHLGSESDITGRVLAEEALSRGIEIEQQRRKQFETLHQVSMALRQVEHPDILQNFLLKEVKALFHMDASAILIPEGNQWKYPIVDGSEQLRDWLFTRETITEKLADIINSGDTLFIPRQLYDIPETTSMAIVPLKSQENILGGMILCWFKPHDFTSDEQRLLGMIAGMGGVALHRMKVSELLNQQIADRSQELSVLYNIAAVANQSLDLTQVLNKSLSQVLVALKSKIGFIHLLEENEKLQLVASQGLESATSDKITAVSERLAQEVIKNDIPWRTHYLTTETQATEIADILGQCPYLGVPIRSKTRVIGVVGIIGEQREVFDKGMEVVLTSIAAHIGLAIEHVRLYHQAQQVAVLEERQRLARDLHDSVTQSLFAMVLMAGSMSKLVEQSNDARKTARHLDKLSQTAHQALKEMRLLVYELRPAVLGKEGLVGALRQRLEAVEKRAQVETQLIVETIPELSPSVEVGLYYLAQEILSNALKHSGSPSVKVHLYEATENWITLEITDMGKGFNLEERENSGGQGLINMRERVKALGGKLSITSEPGKGTRVQIQVGKLLKKA